MGLSLAEKLMLRFLTGGEDLTKYKTAVARLSTKELLNTDTEIKDLQEEESASLRIFKLIVTEQFAEYINSTERRILNEMDLSKSVLAKDNSREAEFRTGEHYLQCYLSEDGIAFLQLKDLLDMVEMVITRAIRNKVKMKPTDYYVRTQALFSTLAITEGALRSMVVMFKAKKDKNASFKIKG